MSENKFENVSSVVDNYQQTDELFDELKRNKLNLTDEVVMGEKIVDGERVPDTKTLKQVIDDVEDDGKIVDFLKDCPGIK